MWFKIESLFCPFLHYRIFPPRFRDEIATGFGLIQIVRWDSWFERSLTHILQFIESNTYSILVSSILQVIMKSICHYEIGKYSIKNSSVTTQDIMIIRKWVIIFITMWEPQHGTTIRTARFFQSYPDLFYPINAMISFEWLCVGHIKKRFSWKDHHLI